MPCKNGSSRTCGEIPILDMSPLVDGSNIQELAKELRSACKDIGFFYAVNHGVSNTVITNAFEASHRFFDQPLENILHLGEVDNPYPQLLEHCFVL